MAKRAGMRAMLLCLSRCVAVGADERALVRLRSRSRPLWGWQRKAAATMHTGPSDYASANSYDLSLSCR
jgi:hypothetical protein